MNVSILISTYGENVWAEMAERRALPSASAQGVPVHLCHVPDATISQVRNAAAELASGDWLCFLDADDELGPGYVQAMQRAYERRRGVDGTPPLLTPAVQKIIKGRERPSTFYREMPLDQGNWLVVGTLIRKDLFMEIGGFSDYPHGFEDWSVWAKAWKAGAEVVKVPRAVYRQYVNPSSKHRIAWRDRKWQVQMHNRVAAELFGE